MSFPTTARDLRSRKITGIGLAVAGVSLALALVAYGVFWMP